MKPVPRIGRAFDLAGLLLFVGGAAVFVRAWLGFQGMVGYESTVGGATTPAVAIADGFWRLQKIGTGAMVAGVVVFVFAWWTARSPSSSPGVKREL